MASPAELAAAAAAFAKVRAEHVHAWRPMFRTTARGPVRIPRRACEGCGRQEPMPRRERELARDDDVMRAAFAVARRGDFALVLGRDEPPAFKMEREANVQRGTSP